MAERLALPPEHVPFIDPPDSGVMHPAWRAFMQGVFKRLGGSTDNVAAALLLSLGAVTGTQIVASRGLQFGGASVDGPIPIGLYKYIGPVAGLPTTGNTKGDHAWVDDGRNSGEGAGSGTGCVVVWAGGVTNLWRINGVATAVAA